MPSPQNLAELQTFMGMVNYLNRFSPIMAQTSDPLRQLIKRHTLSMATRAPQNVSKSQTNNQRSTSAEYPNECPANLKEFWNFREDLSVENGLFLKGRRLLIPSNLRTQILLTEDCLLAGYLKGYLWNDCQLPTCMQFSKRQPKEPLHPQSVPSIPWQKLATDLFDYQGAQYLLVTDYYSKSPIVRKLNSTTSAAVINHIKSIFAKNGMPETLISDNGPQYSSQEFVAFCKQSGIDHVTSSPQYPKATAS